MLAAVCLVAFLTQDADPSALLFASKRPNCKVWAEIANYYIEMGEEKACASLTEYANSHPNGKANTRAGLICRIIFQSKPTLRQPKFGELSLPRLSMPASAWPELPLFQQDGVWFLLDENYRVQSPPERAADYIAYCRKSGKFRTEKVIVPTKEQAGDAFKSLLGSKRWTSIQWSDSASHDSYTYDRQWTYDILRSQTNFRDGDGQP